MGEIPNSNWWEPSDSVEAKELQESITRFYLEEATGTDMHALDVLDAALRYGVDSPEYKFCRAVLSYSSKKGECTEETFRSAMFNMSKKLNAFLGEHYWKGLRD